MTTMTVDANPMVKGVLPRAGSDASSEASDFGQVDECKRALAWAHDQRAIEIERDYKGMWVEVAMLCGAVRDNQEWRYLTYDVLDEEANTWTTRGFNSFNQWVMTRMPCARSMVYLALGIREELKDIPDDELRQMSLGGAQILTKLDKGARTNKVILDAAKTRPAREVLQVAMQHAPAAGLEPVLTKKFKLALSQAKVVELALEMVRQLDEHEYSDAEALERITSSWMLSHQTEWEQRDVRWRQ